MSCIDTTTLPVPDPDADRRSSATDGAGSHRFDTGAAAGPGTGEVVTDGASADPDGFAWHVTAPAGTP